MMDLFAWIYDICVGRGHEILKRSDERGTSTTLIILAIVIAAVGSAAGTYLLVSQDKEGVSKSDFSNLKADVDDLEYTVDGLTEEKEWTTVLDVYENDNTKINYRTETFNISTNRWRIIYAFEGELLLPIGTIGGKNFGSFFNMMVFNADTDEEILPFGINEYGNGRSILAMGGTGNYYIETETSGNWSAYRITVQEFG